MNEVRPTCKKCGNPMSHNGLTKSGKQKYRCSRCVARKIGRALKYGDRPSTSAERMRKLREKQRQTQQGTIKLESEADNG